MSEPDFRTARYAFLPRSRLPGILDIMPCSTLRWRGLRACGSTPVFGALKIMVRIRLARAGAKGRPFYHVVVTDQHNRRDGRNIVRLGYFNPGASGESDKRLELDVEKLRGWVAKGAKCSDRVAALAREAGRQPASSA